MRSTNVECAGKTYACIYMCVCVRVLPLDYEKEVLGGKSIESTLTEERDDDSSPHLTLSKLGHRPSYLHAFLRDIVHVCDIFLYVALSV